MNEHTVRAEFEPLNAVRVHTPGLELWSGSVDPGPNLFDEGVPPDRARREHERLVESLEGAGIEVHQLADDLASGGHLDELVTEYASFPEAVDVAEVLESWVPREKLQLVLSRARFERHPDAATGVHVERPVSNTFFQRDTTMVGDRGPILCEMYEPVRKPEVPIVRRAWEAVGAEFVHEMSGEPLEGGEFLPAGEFALLGVSAEIDGEEVVIRTSYDAGTGLLDAGAVGYDEVGLVRAPLEADRRLREERGGHSRVMHLLGWCNIAAEGLAVVDAELARHATVDVYARDGDGYAFDRSTTTLAYLEDQGFDVVDVSPTERWPTNFLAVDGGRVVPLYEPDADGEYRPEDNPTIERLKERGVEVLPDGEGLPRAALTNGAGGIHCMTTPLSRG
ncbi:MAG: arginine deiminase family protein [Haloarculaceae archaeon]